MGLRARSSGGAQCVMRSGRGRAGGSCQRCGSRSPAADLLDDQVPSFGSPAGQAGVEEREQLGLSGAQRLGEPVALRHVVGLGPPVPVGERGLGVSASVGVVDVARHLLERAGTFEFVAAIRSERDLEPSSAAVGEPLTSADEVAAHRGRTTDTTQRAEAPSATTSASAAGEPASRLTARRKRCRPGSPRSGRSPRPSLLPDPWRAPAPSPRASGGAT
jgi:hypothetical protein